MCNTYRGKVDKATCLTIASGFSNIGLRETPEKDRDRDREPEIVRHRHSEDIDTVKMRQKRNTDRYQQIGKQDQHHQRKSQK